MSAERILVGEIGRPHGVRGLLKLQSFTADPKAIASYGPLSDESGKQRIVLEWLPGGLARIEGVSDRDAAQKLTGTRLYVAREALPAPDEEEFYLADLIGLSAFEATGEAVGEVVAVDDYGAGPFLTIRADDGAERLVTFTRAAVPVVELAARKLILAPVEELEVPPEAEAEAGFDGSREVPDSAPLPRRRPGIDRPKSPRRLRGGGPGGGQ